MSVETGWIRIRGARVHNLQGVDLDLPRGKMIAICGPSGSGKSSLAFDVLFAEGQRRYVESLSAYARQFLERLEKPQVELIEGLSPAISIQQKTIGANPRSTVGTVTEIHDYLRLLFARAGEVHCPHCGKLLEKTTRQQMVERLMGLASGTRLAVMAPVARGPKEDRTKLLLRLRKQGFSRVLLDGELFDLEQLVAEERVEAARVSVYVDRVVIREGVRQRLSDSLEIALGLSDGVVEIAVVEGEDLVFTESYRCLQCEITLPEPEPALFSFNSPQGACPQCHGIGEIWEEEPLSEIQIGRKPAQICPACQGKRLRPEALAVKLAGRSIAELCAMSVEELQHWLAGLELSPARKTIAGPLLKEVLSRLEFMNRVGVGYLSLERPVRTLSGGEAQRVRLATQLGAGLSGVLYVLDEPTVGMHPKDRDLLLQVLGKLRDAGNTVLVVEHDIGTIMACDYVVDMGPGAGRLGGRVIACGTPREVMKNPHSLTGAYLSGARFIPVPSKRRRPRGKLVLRGARGHNLKNITVDFPLGVLLCVTGVSGSGKSSLLIDTLYRELAKRLHRSRVEPLEHDGLEGEHLLQRVFYVDQDPIGRSPRSNPATYTGVWNGVRGLFAKLPESRMRGWNSSRFSFNVKGGRCEACQGAGRLKIEMQFLPDVYVVCEVCRGRRFDSETLAVSYRGLSIDQVLELTVDEALEVFANHPTLVTRLTALRRVGLGYLQLGQSAATLSGGEAQRVKLARELARGAGGRTLYVLDEPTTGLHAEDVKVLMEVLGQLVDQGNSVMIIEHNLDVIKQADWIIDLGPGGGKEGGRLVVSGTPEQVAAEAASHTGRFLKEVLG